MKTEGKIAPGVHGKHLDNLSTKNVVFLFLMLISLVYLLGMLVTSIAYNAELIDHVWLSSTLASGWLRLSGTVSAKEWLNHSRDLSAKGILLYNSFFGAADFKVGLGDSVFTKYNCQQPKCYLTTDKTQIYTVDAVVFHAFQLGSVSVTLPERAHPDQVFVFYLFENPMIANQYDWLNNLDDYFNLTFTYLDIPDTDIVAPHVKFMHTNGSNRLPPRRFPKTKLVSWLVSNCLAKNDRMWYARQLSNHIQVDIYGKCGRLSCGNSCRKVISNYMFYLAFENSNCEDYLTEKVFRSLQLNIVPVVRGGANYSKHLPRHSYIDTRDYPSPAHLAEHLLYLSTNQSAYQEYFAWKTSYRTVGIRTNRQQGFCRLCEILHDKNYSYKSGFDPKKYWDRERLCEE